MVSLEEKERPGSGTHKLGSAILGLCNVPDESEFAQELELRLALTTMEPGYPTPVSALPA
jgi:hypothetical protein